VDRLVPLPRRRLSAATLGDQPPRVISSIVARKPQAANSACAAVFCTIVESTMRGAPMASSASLIATTKARPAPERRALSSTMMSWIAPCSSSSAFQSRPSRLP